MKYYVPLIICKWNTLSYNGANVRVNNDKIQGFLPVYTDKQECEEDFPGVEIREFEMK